MKAVQGRKLRDCDFVGQPKGPAFKAVLAFARSENEWLSNYQLAWKFATENGHDNLKFVDEANGEDAKPYDCGSIGRLWPCK